MNKNRKKKKARSSEAPRTIEDSATPSSETASSGTQPIWRALLSEPVAIGLAIFVLLRPWRDGLTFPPFNIYYSALILLIAALWATRMLLRNETIKFPVPAALFAGFLIVVYLTGFNTIEYNLTHRTFQQLIAHFLLFLLCCNSLRTPLSVGLVLGAVVLSALLNAGWSSIHYYWTLPEMRAVLNARPDLREFYFGPDMTQELRSRLESNRAFGSFLFPNHLGAFAVLVIPYLISQLRPSWRALRRGLRRSYGGRGSDETPADRSVRAWSALGSAIAIWLVTFIGPFLLNTRLGAIRVEGGPPVAGLGPEVLLFGLVPALLGAGAGFLVWRRGLAALGVTLRFAGIFLALPATSYALWLSYSRGATAALIAAGVLTFGLYRFGGRVGPVAGAVSKAAVVVLLAVLLIQGLDGTDALAQEMTRPGLKPSGLHLGAPHVPAPVDEASISLNVEGAKRELGELASLASFKLRVTYWQVGLLMFKDNFWTGVGLGNFKVAYPRYQFLGAGDVEMTHNDYLQAFCETGVFGGALFSAFWIYFVVWGGRRILQEADPSRRALLAGHYAGVVAFALHAIVDFDFANPSLAAFAYVLAGTFYAHARVLGPPDDVAVGKRTQAGRIMAVPLLLLIGLSAGSAVRVFLFDYALTEGAGLQRLGGIGDRRSFQTRTNAATFFLRDLKQKAPSPQEPGIIGLAQAFTLIPDRKLLESFGDVGVPVEGGRPRLLRPNEAPPANAFFVISTPADANHAKLAAMKGAEERVEVLKEWDTMFPHDADVAVRVFSWYDLLFNASDPDRVSDRKRFARAALKWSKTAVDRSPEAAAYRLYYAKALWLVASVESGRAAVLDHLYEGIEEYKTACDLYPNSPDFWSFYGQALQEFGQKLSDAGQTDEGVAMIKQGEEAITRSNQIRNYKNFSWART